jgi:hypothetical protein
MMRERFGACGVLASHVGRNQTELLQRAETREIDRDVQKWTLQDENISAEILNSTLTENSRVDCMSARGCYSGGTMQFQSAYI